MSIWHRFCSLAIKVYIAEETGAAYDGVAAGGYQPGIHDQLLTLPGIGEGRRRRLSLTRRDEGLFTAPEELMKVPGIKAGGIRSYEIQILID